MPSKIQEKINARDAKDTKPKTFARERAFLKSRRCFLASFAFLAFIFFKNIVRTFKNAKKFSGVFNIYRL